MRRLPSTGIGWRHPHYGELLAQLPPLGFIEVHSENFFGAGGAALAVLQQARAHYPVSLHGVGLGLGSAIGIDAWHLEQLAQLVERVDPWLVSDHASFARANVKLPGSATAQGLHTVHAADLLPLPFNREALDLLCANVQQVQDRLQRPLAVENLSAYLQWNGSDQSEPEFLASLARRTGCKLLVDVNNIYVNALNAAPHSSAAATVDHALAACRTWLDAIPADAVAEIHLAGHTDTGDILVDDHGSRVCDAVWSLYRHACKRFGRDGAVPTLIEWDTAIPPLAVLLDEARQAEAFALAAQGHTPG